MNALADYDLRTLLGKDDSSTPPDSLRRNICVGSRKETFGREANEPEQHLGRTKL